MQSQKLKFLLLVIVWFCSMAQANEGAKEAEGQSAAPAVNKESIEYSKKEARLNTLRGRIEEGNKKFEELVKAKNHSQNPQAKQQLAEEMITVEKELRQNKAEFTALKQEVEYQHPNKGKDIDKKLIPTERKSVQEVEQTTGLDAKLSETKKRVDKKYKPLIPKEDLEAEAAAKPAVAAPEAPKKIRLEK